MVLSSRSSGYAAIISTVTEKTFCSWPTCRCRILWQQPFLWLRHLLQACSSSSLFSITSGCLCASGSLRQSRRRPLWVPPSAHEGRERGPRDLSKESPWYEIWRLLSHLRGTGVLTVLTSSALGLIALGVMFVDSGFFEIPITVLVVALFGLCMVLTYSRLVWRVNQDELLEWSQRLSTAGAF